MAQPRFVFSIAPMFPRPNVPERYSHHGRWRPPKAIGNNRKSPDVYFQFEGARGGITTRIQEPPPSLELHKEYSIYYDRAIIWTVNYDASTENVGDGREEVPLDPAMEDERQNASPFRLGSAQGVDNEDSSDDSSNEDEEKDDWAPLKFDHRESDKLSYAARRQPFSRLCVYRQDQEWAQKILPDTCNAEQESFNSGEGGLIGELPLLIGLMALAIPQDQVSRGLCESMGQPWTAPQFERRAGWRDRRGLIVKTYAYPGHSTREDLIEYEEGRRGIMLP